MTSRFAALSESRQKIVKTGLAAGAVYGAAHLLGEVRKARRSFPTFEEDFDKREAKLLLLDHTLSHCIHRLYTLIKRQEHFSGKTWIIFCEASRAVAKALEAADVLCEPKAANKQNRRAEEKLDCLELVFKREPVAMAAASQDIELIKDGLNAHLQNLLIDVAFPEE